MKQFFLFLFVFLSLLGARLDPAFAGLSWEAVRDLYDNQDSSVKTYSSPNFKFVYIDNCTAYPDDCFSPSTISPSQALNVFSNMLESVRYRLYSYGFDQEPCDTHHIYIVDSGAQGRSLGKNDTALSGETACDYPVMEFNRNLVQNNISLVDVDPWTRNVAVHEFFHTIDSYYRTRGATPNAGRWTVEGQAVAVSDKIFTVNDEGEDGFPRNNEYYLNRPVNLTYAGYDAALFWSYLMEQYGAERTEPGVGMDALVAFWEAVESFEGNTNTIEAIERMADTLGFPGTSFQDIYKDFVVANYLKRRTGSSIPAKYKYLDEAQPPGSYGSVRRLGKIPNDGVPMSGQDFVDSWQPKYYGFGRGRQTTDVMKVTVNQITNEELYFVLLVTRGQELISEFRSVGTQFSKTLVGLDPADSVGLIVSGLSNRSRTPAKYNYSLTPNDSLGISIKSPNGAPYQAWVGGIDAPQKFLSIVEVMDTAGPVRGLTLNDFTAHVRSELAPVIAAAFVGGLYFLEILAPPQQANNSLGDDLAIAIGNRATVKTRSVRYSPRNDIIFESIVVLDKSYSMKHLGKMEAAKAAARLYVDSFQSGDRMGVVQYDDQVDLLQGLADVDIVRNDLLDQIEQIEARGQTAIGSALGAAQTELTNNALGEGIPHIFLLTDGRENVHPKLDGIFWDTIAPTNTRMDVVAIGADAQVAALEEAANASSGRAYFAFNPSSGTLVTDLGDIYRAAAEDLRGEERVIANKKVLSGTWSISEKARISDASEATVVFKYRSAISLSNHTKVFLKVPGVGPVPPTVADEFNGLAQYYGHFIWRIPNPPAGDYTFDIGASGEIEYLFESSVKSPITINAYFGRERTSGPSTAPARELGDVIPILAILSDDAPIQGGKVVATVKAGTTYKNSQSWKVKLFDDGQHGDGAKDDGVYANDFTPTGGLINGKKPDMSGATYSVRVAAHGTSNSGLAFTRETSGAFHVSENIDSDGDGLPDRWENKYNLNPFSPEGRNGASGDADSDGLTNIRELEFGSNPDRFDTDRGGESDLSEVEKGRNPSNKSDDATSPPTLYALPGNGSASLFPGAFNVHRKLSIYRATGLKGDFKLIQKDVDARKREVRDTALRNGQTYYYKVVADDKNGNRSGFSESVAVTPKSDPVPPSGYVLINKGEPASGSRDVRLEMEASPDAIEMRISNTLFFDRSPWRNMADKVRWRLAGDGRQSVFVQFRDAAGNIGGRPTGDPRQPADYTADSIKVVAPKK